MRKILYMIILLITDCWILTFSQFWVRIVRRILIIMAMHNLQNPVPISAVETACIDTVALPSS